MMSQMKKNRNSYRSAYRFTNTMINKGDQYEQINDMATMFAKMMSQMKKNRNSYTPYSSNSHHGNSNMEKMKMMMKMMKMSNSYTPYSSNSRHGNSNMEKMKMMMKMMKMSNMMNDNQDYSSSSYSNDNDAFDMFSEIFDSSDRMDNYRSSYDNKNQMGRMSHFKNMFNSMRFKRAAGDNLDEKLAEQRHHMEAKIGNMTCVMRELNVLDA